MEPMHLLFALQEDEIFFVRGGRSTIHSVQDHRNWHPETPWSLQRKNLGAVDEQAFYAARSFRQAAGKSVFLAGRGLPDHPAGKT